MTSKVLKRICTFLARWAILAILAKILIAIIYTRLTNTAEVNGSMAIDLIWENLQ